MLGTGSSLKEKHRSVSSCGWHSDEDGQLGQLIIKSDRQGPGGGVLRRRAIGKVIALQA